MRLRCACPTLLCIAIQRSIAAMSHRSPRVREFRRVSCRSHDPPQKARMLRKDSGLFVFWLSGAQRCVAANSRELSATGVSRAVLH
jgi:hypothetical protein